MDGETIRQKVDLLPIIPLFLHEGVPYVAEDHEIWEFTDGGAHFKVTRHHLLIPAKPEMLTLSVSGEESERERIISEFIEVFGEPDDRDVSPVSPVHVDMVAWLIDDDLSQA